jgi:hypothetical protein
MGILILMKSTSDEGVVPKGRKYQLTHSETAVKHENLKWGKIINEDDKEVAEIRKYGKEKLAEKAKLKAAKTE